MNAPTHYSQLAVEVLPIASIVVSSTPEQARRRATFTDTELDELAASIRPTGVLQPILVRPIEGGKYEIVAGERRYLASQRAGFDTIPANIREMDDGEVLFAQIVENLQRKGLTAMEEAEGYTRLMKLRDMNADAIGTLIGKSRSYVYTRTKLLDLCPGAQAALAAGEIDASGALVIARLPSPKLQTLAIERVRRSPHWNFRTLLDDIRNRLMQTLSDAPWLNEDEGLLPLNKRAARELGLLNNAGIHCFDQCATCPHNSANDAELTEALEGEHVCTNEPCYNAKKASYWDRRRHRLEQEGKTVISGNDVAQYVNPYGRPSYGLVDLDEECYLVENPAPEPEDMDSPEWNRWNEWCGPTYRQLLTGETFDTIMVVTDKRIVEIAKKADIAPILKKKHKLKLDVPGTGKNDDSGDDFADEDNETPEQRAAREAKEQQARQIDSEYRQRLFITVAGKIKSPLKKPDLLRVAHHYWEQIEYSLEEQQEHVIEVVFGKYPPAIDKMDDTELLKFICLIPAIDDLEYMVGKPADLLDLATRHKVDAKKLKTTVTAEVKAAAKTEAKK